MYIYPFVYKKITENNTYSIRHIILIHYSNIPPTQLTDELL